VAPRSSGRPRRRRQPDRGRRRGRRRHRLEQGGGRAVDELVLRIPDAELTGLLLAEVSQVDGVDVEDLRPAPPGMADGELAALETAALLATADTTDEVLSVLCSHVTTTMEATWAAVADLGAEEYASAAGIPPSYEWVAAFVRGSQASARLRSSQSGPDDVAWAPLPATELKIVLARPRSPFRARERREVAALARVAGARLADLARWSSRLRHPSCR
jgi:hypothetical protein